MPVQVSQLPNEHILLCVYSDPLDVGDLRQIETQSVTLAAAWEGPVFRIGDIRNLNISFGDLVVTLADASKSGNPGSLADPKFKDSSRCAGHAGGAGRVKHGSEAVRRG